MGRLLAGKKTYLLAALLCAVAVGLVFAQRISPATAFAIALFAAGSFGATFRAALQQHHDEVMEILAEVAESGAAVTTHHYNVAGVDAQDVARRVSRLMNECRQGAQR